MKHSVDSTSVIMFRLVLFLLGITLTVVNAVKFSDLPTAVNITLGQDATFTVSVMELNGEELSWMVGETRVANLTSGSEGLALNGGKTLDDSLYNVSTINNDTTLTLKSPTMTFNGSKVKLTNGTVESSTSTLLIMVLCGQLENGASASCFDVGCTASGDASNDNTTVGKYRKCVDSYSCESDGTWSESNRSCTELICVESGKWGENCTMDCGDGCQMKMCFANGSCMNVTACNEGYAGDKCDQQVTVIAAASNGQTETSPVQISPSSTSSTSASSSTPASSSATSVSSSATSVSPSAASSSIIPESSSAASSSIIPESSSAAPIAGSCIDTGLPPSEVCSTPGENMTTVRTCEPFPGRNETCTTDWTCDDGKWINQRSQGTFTCMGSRTWGPECRHACGEGCRVKLTVECDPVTGQCMDPDTGMLKKKGQCADGYKGDNCDQPICVEDCNGGVCLAPNYCGNCPWHHEHGRNCRNLRLDGFLKGSLPALAILAAVVIVLTLSSKWHIRNKIKEA